MGSGESGRVGTLDLLDFTSLPSNRDPDTARRVVVRPEEDGGYRGTALSTHSRSPCALRGAGAQGPARWAEREPWQPPSWPGELVGGTTRYRADVRVSRDLFLHTVVFENFSFYE